MPHALGPISCYKVLVNKPLSRLSLMHFIVLLPIKILVAMALAQSMRRSFHIRKAPRVMDQIGSISEPTFIDDLKMASAVTIAAAVMIPALLVFAFLSWLSRSLLRWAVLVDNVVSSNRADVLNVIASKSLEHDAKDPCRLFGIML